MFKKGVFQGKDMLALIVIIIGAIGMMIWGLGLSSIGTPTLRWLGASIVAIICVFVAILSRWIQ